MVRRASLAHHFLIIKLKSRTTLKRVEGSLSSYLFLMTVTEVKEYLDSFVNYELSPSHSYGLFRLDRMVNLLDCLGNPQKKFACVHVAGTKGKGSTCAFAAYILQAAGYRAGLYTSPHLHEDLERIRILPGRCSEDSLADPFLGKISKEQFNGLVAEYKPRIEKARESSPHDRISFFEIYTALAFVYFAQQKADVAVLETGLGGRLDATNVVDPLVCAITPISIEHTRYMGDTLQLITAEKAAIIKKHNQIAVIAPQKDEAREAIRRHSLNLGARLIFIGEDICCRPVKQDINGQFFHIRGLKDEYTGLRTRLLGGHQAVNAATAVGLVEILSEKGFKIQKEDIYRGIENTLWPGRFEIIQKNPLIVLDGAHNPESCLALAETCRKIFPGKRIFLILGISEDKDTAGICSALGPIAQKIILTKANHPRAFHFSSGPQDLFAGKEVIYSENTRQALDIACQEAQKEDVILAAGSLFVIGEIRALFRE